MNINSKRRWMRMVEIISDMTMIWVSIFMTMLFLTAFAKVNVFFIEWELRTNWKRQLVDMESYDDDPPFLFEII
jgi:hypothetical protein